MYKLLIALILIYSGSAAAQIKICQHRSWPSQYVEALQQATAFWEDKLVFIGPCTGPGQVPVAWKTTWKRPAHEIAVRFKHPNGFQQVHVNGTLLWDTNLFISPKALHLQSVIAHELGHVLGLKHSKRGIMQPEISPGEIQMYNIKDPNLTQYTKGLKPLLPYLWIRVEAE